MEEGKKPNCFVIMPFGGYFDSYYKDVYAKAIDEAGFVPQRGDDLFGTGGNIVNQIWGYTQKMQMWF